jgi:hypothetical protein
MPTMQSTRQPLAAHCRLVHDNLSNKFTTWFLCKLYDGCLQGLDFDYANAPSWFENLDRLIHYVNLVGDEQLGSC